MIKKRFFKTKDEVEVTFEWPKGDINNIALAADFNQWQATPMKLNKKTKTYNVKVRLPKNQSYQFRYIINESLWENDPKADGYIKNNYGDDNSILSTSVTV
ncbi:isoamylase early set domain-containing protein [Photobacterium sp.]|uniref:isoamylase early set domain-containing protein n=1 Tax=Photobacterium sp. TaxID=660 RepID=UPI00299ECB1A|nr:isoamylase early set domain-containing protein [Photobacterium sp.]MDX1301389.1 isoamylase early set domain-containing protein [Photobacterium sp.]